MISHFLIHTSFQRDIKDLVLKFIFNDFQWTGWS